MELSELQKIIIGGLNLCGLNHDDIIAIMLLLQDEEKQWKMADYLDATIDNPPEKTAVFKAAMDFAEE